MNKKLKIVFCGTPDFALPTLEMLYNHPNTELVKIITMPDRPSGRGEHLKAPPVAIFAKSSDIPLIQTENINKESSLLQDLKETKIDLIIVLAFAQFLSEEVINLPFLGCFNIHTSLLPKYRGAAPIQYAILNGDKTTGVSIQKVVKKMDAGDLVYNKEVPIGINETGGELYDRLKLLAAVGMSDFLSDLISKGVDGVTYTPQDESKVTFARSLKKKDGLIDFEIMSFKEINRKVRAFTPWPSTYFFMDKRRIKILEVLKDEIKLEAGEISITYNTLSIGCRGGDTARITKLQQEGKRPCSDTEFLNGLKDKNKR